MTPRIGLALIAKDEEARLPRLLESLGIQKVEGRATPSGVWHEDAQVDFVTLCDTGSTDRTIEVAMEYGCRVVNFTWVQDFSKARQMSYDHLPPECDWSLWADCDDVIHGGENLRAMAAQAPPMVGGFLFPYDYARDEEGNCICHLWRERLVRRVAERAWELPIHEILKVEGALVKATDVTYVHHPAEEGRAPKRNYLILKADVERAEAEDRDPDPRTLVYLGTETLALGKVREATRWLRRYLEVGQWDEECCQAAHKLSIAWRSLKTPDLEKAEEAARLAIQHRPDWPDGYLDLAEIALRRERPDRALLHLDAAGKYPPPETLLIVNPLDYTYAPTLMKAHALGMLGRVAEAFEETQRALQMTPQREDLQAQAGRLASELKAQETEKHVLALRELLCRHDENAKALRLLENVPYYIWDRPAISQARQDQREMVLHAFEPDVYERYYQSNPREAPFEEQGIPIEESHKVFQRLGFLRQGLEEQAQGIEGRKLKVLDLSGNDGWMACNLTSAGHKVDMIEMNPDCARRANLRREQFPGLGRVECGDLHQAHKLYRPGAYDAVVCFETIEHVPDPQRLIQAMLRMVRPGGRIYISTPDGAYERGMDPIMSGWHVVEAKGHLRAIRPDDLASWLCERGIVRGFAVLPDRTVVASLEPSQRKGKVIFYAGAGFVEPLPEKILTEGLGGSETALCKTAEIFARRGYDVRVYAGSGGGLRGDRVTIDSDNDLDGQVLYAPATAWDPGEEADLLVVSRIPAALDRTIRARNVALWLHDADYGAEITPERIERADKVIVLSEFQRDLLTKRYPCLDGKAIVSRNGIEPAFYSQPEEDRQPWVVYSSSPDRGLDVLLELWPEVKARVPDAELHHTYAPVYGMMRKTRPDLDAFHRRVERLAAKCDGVVRHEGLGQQALAKLYQQAKVWAYPSWHSMGGAAFPEISCITAMEAQAGGCVPVHLDFAALQETVVCGEAIPGPATSETFRKRFVDAIVRGLTDDAWRQREAVKGRTHALGLDWEGVVDDWERALLKRTPEQEREAA